MDMNKWMPDQSRQRKREPDYAIGQRPVDAVALKKRKLEREAQKSSGKQDRKGSLFECKLCDAIFLQPTSLQKHARQKHKEERELEMGLHNMDSNDPSLKCSHCGIYFSSHLKLEYHLSSLMESVPKPRIKVERTTPEINLKLEPTINIKVDPDQVVSTATNTKVKSEPRNVKLEEHMCSDCDFRTFVRLEYMDHVLYDCGTGGEFASTGQPQEMGEGWSFKSGTFFCLMCQFSTKEKTGMFGHIRKVHSKIESSSRSCNL